MSFETAHNRYLDPPDEDPICEDGCGEPMKKDINGDWYCENKFCPLKWEGDAKEMAEMLIGATETIKSLTKKLHNVRLVAS